VIRMINHSPKNTPRRGVEQCRGCDAPGLFPVFDLGELPIANELPLSSDFKVEVFPLEFSICLKCGLGQVGEPVTETRLFEDYRYLSSISETWLQHSKKFAEFALDKFNLGDKDLVLEIASNDGYLLHYFKKLECQIYGIEPASNVAELANSKGIPTWNVFFNSKTAKEFCLNHQVPKLIIANNVAAHVPDLKDFFIGLSMVSGQDSYISIENPSILNLLVQNQFDTIYHEHYSYLSAHAVQEIASSVGLHLLEVEALDTHGGSNRYLLGKNPPTLEQNNQVERYIEFEIASGLLNNVAWLHFSSRVTSAIGELNNWFDTCNKTNRRVFGFAAAAKASTLINLGKFDSADIIAIADSSHEKQGRFMPSQGIRIISLQELKESNPTDILIFSWNISSEISNVIWNLLGEHVRCWIAVPELREITR